MPFTIQSILNPSSEPPAQPTHTPAVGSSQTPANPDGLTQSRTSNDGPPAPRNTAPGTTAAATPAVQLPNPAATALPTGPLTIGYVTLHRPDNIQAALTQQAAFGRSRSATLVSSYNGFLQNLEQGRLAVPRTNEVVTSITRFRELAVPDRHAMVQAAERAGVLLQHHRSTINRLEGLGTPTRPAAAARTRLDNPDHNAALSMLENMDGLRLNDHRFYKNFLKRLEQHGVSLPNNPNPIRDINQFRTLSGADQLRILNRLEYDRTMQGGTRACVQRVEQLIREQQASGAPAPGANPA